MEEFENQEELYRVYARTENGVVVRFFSTAFDEPTQDDVLIEETSNRHRANDYEVKDINGLFNYEIAGGQLTLRDKTQDIIEFNQKRYPTLVAQKIREVYSIDDEMAILRQKDIKQDEYQAYFSFCEQCKTQARQELGL